MLKEAGLDRINHNLNTSRSNYPNICTTHTYEQRVNNIHMLQDLGFEICSGGIIGMGESKEDVVDMLLDLKEINPEALPINFLIPIKGTPLQDRDTSNLTPEYCLKYYVWQDYWFQHLISAVPLDVKFILKEGKRNY